jgi:hypothetical protein
MPIDEALQEQYKTAYPRLRQATRTYFSYEILLRSSKQRITKEQDYGLDATIVEGLSPILETAKKEIRAAAKQELPPFIQARLDGVFRFPRVLIYRILAETGDLRRFPGPRSLRHYCGIHPHNGKAARKTKGQKLSWSPRIKSVLLSPEKNGLGTQLLMLKVEPFVATYYHKKEYLKQRDPAKLDIWLHQTARRHMLNQVLNWLWEIYQGLNEAEAA